MCQALRQRPMVLPVPLESLESLDLSKAPQVSSPNNFGIDAAEQNSDRSSDHVLNKMTLPLAADVVFLSISTALIHKVGYYCSTSF